MATDLLPATTAMGAVTLHVADLPGMTAYYRDALGLVELAANAPVTAVDRAGAGSAGAAHVILGRAGTPLVVLVHTPGLPPSKPGEAGLFHTALLFPDRSGLADCVARAAQHSRTRYVGSADHGVSNAFYFTDPDDNGIELYWDRPRDQWHWEGGRLAFHRDPLDTRAFLGEHVIAPVAEPARSTAEVGHVHLKVGDIPTARAFYVDALGFEVTAETPGALFIAAGGYHHHMAVNTWASRGAGARAATIGLGQASLVVAQRSDIEALADRLRYHGTPVSDDGRTLRFEDPWKSLLEVSAADAD